MGYKKKYKLLKRDYIYANSLKLKMKIIKGEKNNGWLQ